MLRFFALWAIGTVIAVAVFVSELLGIMWLSLAFSFPYFALTSLLIGVVRVALLGDDRKGIPFWLAATATWTATLALTPLANLLVLSRDSYYFEISWLLSYPYYLLVTFGYGILSWCLARKSEKPTKPLPKRFLIGQAVAAAVALAVTISRTSLGSLDLPPEIFYVTGLSAAVLALAAAPCRIRQRGKAEMAPVP